jgi:hypothetical protein
VARNKRVTGYIDETMGPDWDAYVKHLGVSESAAVEWAVRAEILRFKGENTKEKMLEQIVEILTRQEGMLGLLQREKWTQIAAPDGRVEVRMKLDDADLASVLAALAVRA